MGIHQVRVGAPQGRGRGVYVTRGYTPGACGRTSREGQGCIPDAWVYTRTLRMRGGTSAGGISRRGPPLERLLPEPRHRVGRPQPARMAGPFSVRELGGTYSLNFGAGWQPSSAPVKRGPNIFVLPPPESRGEVEVFFWFFDFLVFRAPGVGGGSAI